MEQYYISGIFLGVDVIGEGNSTHVEKILSKYSIDSIKQGSYTSLKESGDVGYDNFLYILQGYLDALYLNTFNVLDFPKLLKNLFDKHISIPYTENQDTITFNRQCNVFDLLNIIYKKPVSKYHTYFHFNRNINPVNCSIRVVDNKAVIPNKVRLSDVGYDLTVVNKHKQLNSTTALYDTGIQIQVPFGYYTEIVPRSSLSKSGYMLSNSMGIIDNSYTGNLYVALTKVAPEVPEIEFPFKCCQLILKRQHFMNINIQYDELEATHRQDGGFGSTN